MRGLLRDTFKRALAGRALHILAVITVLACLGAATSTRLEFNFEMQTSGLEIQDLGDGLESVFGFLLKGLATFFVFTSVMASAGTFPSILARGTAEFYLSQPLSRHSFYMRKLASLWIVYGGATACCLLAVSTVTAISFGFFPSIMPFLIILVLVRIAVWFCFTGFVGILSGSTVFTIISSFVLWLTQIYLARWRGGWSDFADSVFGRKAVFAATDVLYWILPKEPEIIDLFELLADGGTVDSWMPLWTTALSAVVILAVTMVLFRRKDY